MRNPLRFLVRGLAMAGALLLVLLIAPPSFAAPAMNVSQLTGLKDGQTITVSASGFEPNLTSIAMGECIAGYTGPSDCNTSGGATFRNADAQGNVASFTLVVKEVFGSHDCTKVQCMIAAAPLPTASDDATIAANTVEMNITFASAETETTAPAPTDSAAPLPSDPEEALPHTGAGDSLPVMLLAASALLASGAGVMLLVPSRRRNQGLR